MLRLAYACVFWLSLGAAGALAAPNAPSKRAKAANAAKPGKVVKLWNGDDLTGWIWVPARGHEGTKIGDVWSVRDGNLHCKGSPGGYIRTEKDYTSFILKLRVRHLQPGNGGVLVRVIGPDKVWPKSIEAQGQAGALGDIWNIDQFPMLVDEKRTQGRHTARARPETLERPLGEWNDYEITLDGADLELTVNGTVQNTATGVQIVAGKIALQSEGSEYEFRDLELVPLPDQGRGKSPGAPPAARPGTKPARP
jgi:hypothetical protein